MTIFSQAFLALVCRHFMAFSFFTAWHVVGFLNEFVFLEIIN
jgi:hypothetical protein